VDSKRMDAPRATPVLAGARLPPHPRAWGVLLFALVYLAATAFVARSDLGVQSLILVAAVFAVLAISLDLVAGMLGLYSLGQGGFFAIGAYLTTVVVNDLGWNVFLMLLIVLAVAGLVGLAVGAMSLRVSGLYFAITTFIFTLVLTVLATDLKITGGLQGLLGPAFPDFPAGLEWLGTPLAWCVMLALLMCMGVVWNIRQSPLYPVLLSIRDAERFAEAAGVRTSLIKIGVFGLSAAMAGGAGWLFAFLGVVSPGQFDWAVSLNILVMVLIGGINTTLGPVIGAAFVSMFPDIVNINPWLQEIVYGALSILAVTLLPGGVISLLKPWFAAMSNGRSVPIEEGAAAESLEAGREPVDATREAALFRNLAPEEGSAREASDASQEMAVECRGIQFSYGAGLPVLRNVDLEVKRGHIHGLIGPNGSGKSTLANVIAGRLHPSAGTTLVKGVRVDGVPPSRRAKLGMRRTFQAAELVRELTPSQNVMVGLFDRVPRIVERAAFWPMLRSGRRDMASMESRTRDALEMVGAGGWMARAVGDVPHGVEQLTQLASVCVARPDIIILDEPATGLSAREVDHLAGILTQLKAQGVTMIIIEHQTRFLFPLCDRVTVLNAGEVILTGTADEVRAHPVVRQVYLGE
jgi:branched-chain amino acid transport system permease protein